jgi:hypothetical protein
VASLQARSPLRSSHPLFFINKLVSLAAFVVLLGAGWVAVSYLKTDLLNRWPGGAVDAPSKTSAGAAVRLDGAAPAETRRLTTPVRLVYSCSGDNEYYHTSTHLPSRRERTALGEEAALQRGLKPCPVCLNK